MFTNKAIDELASWTEAVKAGDKAKADTKLQQFHHLGASLLASKDFQQRFEEEYGCKLEPSDLECLYHFLAEIGKIEGEQIEQFGPA